MSNDCETASKISKGTNQIENLCDTDFLFGVDDHYEIREGIKDGHVVAMVHFEIVATSSVKFHSATRYGRNAHLAAACPLVYAAYVGDKDAVVAELKSKYIIEFKDTDDICAVVAKILAKDGCHDNGYHPALFTTYNKVLQVVMDVIPDNICDSYRICGIAFDYICYWGTEYIRRGLDEYLPKEFDLEVVPDGVTDDEDVDPTKPIKAAQSGARRPRTRSSNRVPTVPATSTSGNNLEDKVRRIA